MHWFFDQTIFFRLKKNFNWFCDQKFCLNFSLETQKDAFRQAETHEPGVFRTTMGVSVKMFQSFYLSEQCVHIFVVWQLTGIRHVGQCFAWFAKKVCWHFPWFPKKRQGAGCLSTKASHSNSVISEEFWRFLYLGGVLLSPYYFRWNFFPKKVTKLNFLNTSQGVFKNQKARQKTLPIDVSQWVHVV